MHFFWSGLARIRAIEWVLIFVQVAFVLATRLGQPPIDIDDAYTHFHVAQNWAEGRGFVFNEGERVIGTTSPVYVAALAGLHRVIPWIPVHILAKRFNMLIDIALVLMAVWWLARAGMPLMMRHAAGLILTAEPLRMHYSLAGMEMSFFILAVMVIFELAGRGQWIIPGIILGVLGWIRPEGAVVWVAVCGGLWAAGRVRVIPRLIGVAVVVAAAMAGSLASWCGTFIPQSIIAKSAAPWYTETGFSATMFMIRLGDLTPFFAIHGTVANWGRLSDNINSILIASAQIGLMATGAAWLWQRGQRMLATGWSLFEAGWFAFYAAARPNIIDWYYVPYFFGSLLLACAGWQAIGEAVWARVPAGLRSWSRVAAAAAIALLLGCYWLSLSHQITRAGRGCDKLTQQLAFRFNSIRSDAREPEYEQIAKIVNGWIGERKETRIGCTEIGVFGYYYRGRVLDVYGLISPEAMDVLKPETLAKLPPGCRIFPYAALMTFKPEMFLTWPKFAPPAPPQFNELYQRLNMEFDVHLFVRRDLVGRLPIPPEMLKKKEPLNPEPRSVDQQL
ncbi:hypothetical protein LLG95_12620 [bacterium]|nr:hypothetical protein [bacterium]